MFLLAGSCGLDTGVRNYFFVSEAGLGSNFGAPIFSFCVRS
ncbi:hypothetical protein KIS1582_4287 [Cytobacillus firmus]|uniref:Uncharacterized protein n=1 Tax=Cytobacillus firmus TaxID=1399 RepID=A0A800MT20_CYTFI|nr:hypothetical protein KIS1582_4287 [Cytobacillus firmus]